MLHFMDVANYISEGYLSAEKKLEDQNYQVVRLVKNGQVEGLQIYGQMFQDLQAVREILPAKFIIVLNPNYQTITIKLK